jgi:hypothetical protein
MNLEQLSIDQLAALRDEANTVLAERASARQKELPGETDKLSALLGQTISLASPILR